MTDSYVMKGEEFIRKLKRRGHKNGIPVKLVYRRGKGSHATLFYGTSFTIIPDIRHELKTGTLHAMLQQLGLSLEDL
jgi:mRNA interferase HicA